MEPVIARQTEQTKNLGKGVPADMIACLISAALCAGAFAYATYFFLRFLENDSHWQGVLAAFTLCYGLGSLAFIPAAILARLSWKTYNDGPTRRRLAWAAVILLPWLVLGLILIFYSGLPLSYAISLFTVIMLLSLWAVTRFIQARRQVPPPEPKL